MEYYADNVYNVYNVDLVKEAARIVVALARKKHSKCATDLPLLTPERPSETILAFILYFVGYGLKVKSAQFEGTARPFSQFLIVSSVTSTRLANASWVNPASILTAFSLSGNVSCLMG